METPHFKDPAARIAGFFKALSHLALTELGKEQLTEQEQTVVPYMLNGTRQEDAATDLHCSPRTVEAYMTDVRVKINANNRFAAPRRLIETGIVDRPSIKQAKKIAGLCTAEHVQMLELSSYGQTCHEIGTALYIGESSARKRFIELKRIWHAPNRVAATYLGFACGILKADYAGEDIAPTK